MGRMIDLRGDGALFIGYNGEYEVWAIDPEATVDAVPVRHGRWINRNPRVDISTCSCCEDRWGSASVMNYCPSCGAKMDAERKEDEDC